MCGILIYSSDQPIRESEFNMMRDTLAHRGPDGYGSHFLENNQVALGHRRLSIIDLSEKGKQPMTNEHGDIWLTYNGEIYNYQVLRNELIECGHSFISNTDSEILIHGYEEWGTEILNRLQGMFAFALYDKKKSEWFIARDHFGIKPLYYYQQGSTFIAASELKAIVAWPDIQKEIDWSSVADYLVYRFIPNPKSIWKNSGKVRPGSYMIIDASTGSIKREETYWNASDFIDDSQAFNQEYFFSILTESVQDHMISDVDVGVFLSGGLDSSTIASIASSDKQNLHSYSMGFEGWSRSEHKAAEEVAKSLNLIQHTKLLQKEKLDRIDEIMRIYDEPQGGSSFLPTIALSEFAAENHKVILAGDGGDELLGGYNWHPEITGLRPDLTEWILKKKFQTRVSQKYHELLSWSGLSFGHIDKLITDYSPHRASSEDLYTGYLTEYSNSIKQVQLLDIHTFMTDVFLPKVDRASMASSLEIRVPFLNHKLFEYVLSCKSDGYYNEGDQKRPLKKLLQNVVSENILNKPKQGFGAPINAASDIAFCREEILSGSLVKNGLFNRKVLADLSDKKGFKAIWPMFLFQKWFDTWN